MSRRDQEGPGHFYDLTFLVKSVPSVRIILCRIAILHRYGTQRVCCALSLAESAPHHLKECPSHVTVRCDDVVVQPGRLGDVKLVIVCLLTPTEQPRHKLNCKYFQLHRDKVSRQLDRAVYL